jgi:hypothetical protein
MENGKFANLIAFYFSPYDGRYIDFIKGNIKKQYIVQTALINYFKSV